MKSDWASECMAPSSMGRHWSSYIQTFDLAHISSRAIILLNALMWDCVSSQCADEMQGWCVHNYPIDLGHTHVDYMTSKEVHHWQIGWENQIHDPLSSTRALKEVFRFCTHAKVRRPHFESSIDSIPQCALNIKSKSTDCAVKWSLSVLSYYIWWFGINMTAALMCILHFTAADF